LSLEEANDQIIKNIYNRISVSLSLEERNPDLSSVGICFVVNTTGGENAHMFVSLVMLL
jgi:hypothetical protein